MSRGADSLSLYLIVGRDVLSGRSMNDVVADAVDGGVTAVQLRQKNGAARQFVDDALTLLDLLRGRHVPLIINDRVDVALVVGADGAHIGQDDISAEDARRLLGRERIVGVSVTSAFEAGRVDARVVDYVGVGPVYSTPSKADAAPPLGVVATADIIRSLKAPVVAIGGINRTNVDEVLTTGVAGIAVISAICGAPDASSAAAALAARLRDAPRGATA